MPEQGRRFEPTHNHRLDCSVPRRTAGEVWDVWLLIGCA